MRVLIAPPVLALLPEYAAQHDPVPELRSALADACLWLGPARVLAARPQAARVGRALLGDRVDESSDDLLVMANGSAMRTDKAPGYFDSRAQEFDAAVEAALADGNPHALARIDQFLAQELWADTAALTGLAEEIGGARVVQSVVEYADIPYGVAYWVVRWTCAS